MLQVLLGLVCVTGFSPVQPVLSLNLDGSISSPSPTKFRAGTQFVAVPGGVGVELDGTLSGISIADDRAFWLRDGITVSAWLRPRSHVSRGPGAQILLRGDDRPGLDPYSLVIHPNGRILFSVQNDRQEAANVSAPIRLHRWTHVVGSLDGFSGVLRLYINGKLADVEITSVLPLLELDAQAAPGVGIGNVQWDRGPHNQPFHGTIADLRLYAEVCSPVEVGFNPEGWIVPQSDEGLSE